MLRIDNLKLKPPIEGDEKDALLKKASKKLNLKPVFFRNFKIIRRSLDARKKNNIFYVYSVCFSLFLPEQDIEALLKNKKNDLKLYDPAIYEPEKGFKHQGKYRPVIAGCGPAGLFAALVLTRAGFDPLIIERGASMEERIALTEEFKLTGKLDPETNIQFGEGGAGTFSDGKLFSHLHDRKGTMDFILRTFVKYGADEDILYDAKPHIGTDVLRKVIVNMREDLKSMGAEFRFKTALVKPLAYGGKLSGICLRDKEGRLSELECRSLILATGHSSRDTFLNLHDSGVHMESKPFAAGFRFIHPQALIDEAQYGVDYALLKLPPADYKLVYHAKSGRAVYSFCMCPGGIVINASSIKGSLAVNGMSLKARDSGYANSAIVAAVDESDYGSGLFDGMLFQEMLEKKAFEAGAGKIPAERFVDFEKNTGLPDNIKTEGIWPYRVSDMSALYPENINTDIKEAVKYFGSIIKGFDGSEAVMAGVETRTSSPLRIPRNERSECNIKGLYPCGEGAGYAGGITSAAADGMKVANNLIMNYN